MENESELGTWHTPVSADSSKTKSELIKEREYTIIAIRRLGKTLIRKISRKE